MFKWLKHDEYNKEVKLYELISEEVMVTYVKKILDKILFEYDNVVSKGSHDISNCKLVKYNIKLNDKKLIKCKQFSKSAKENEWIKG